MGDAFWLMKDAPRQGGLGPAFSGDWSSTGEYTHPAAGWGAALTVGKVLFEQRQPVAGTKAMFTMNHPQSGFDCPGCAWPEEPGGRKFAEFCENGAKAVAEEATKRVVTPEFFARHSVTELGEQPEFWLSQQGRLTHPQPEH